MGAKQCRSHFQRVDFPAGNRDPRFREAPDYPQAGNGRLGIIRPDPRPETGHGNRTAGVFPFGPFPTRYLG